MHVTDLLNFQILCSRYQCTQELELWPLRPSKARSLGLGTKDLENSSRYLGREELSYTAEVSGDYWESREGYGVREASSRVSICESGLVFPSLLVVLIRCPHRLEPESFPGSALNRMSIGANHSTLTSDASHASHESHHLPSFFLLTTTSSPSNLFYHVRDVLHLLDARLAETQRDSPSAIQRRES